MNCRRSLGVIFLCASFTCLATSTLVTWEDKSVLGQLLGATMLQAVWLCAAAGAILTFRNDSMVSTLGLGPAHLGIFCQLCIVSAFVLISNAVGWLLVWIGQSDGETLATSGRLITRSDGPLFLIALMTIGILPGLAEEIFFRGFLQRSIRESRGPAISITTAAVLFGLIHGNPVHAGVAVILGLYLGVAAHWSGSTRIAMLCHATNNTFALLLAGW